MEDANEIARKYTNNLEISERNSANPRQAELGPLSLQVPQTSSYKSDESDEARRLNLHSFIYGLSF